MNISCVNISLAVLILDFMEIMVDIEVLDCFLIPHLCVKRPLGVNGLLGMILPLSGIPNVIKHCRN